MSSIRLNDFIKKYQLVSQDYSPSGGQSIIGTATLNERAGEFMRHHLEDPNADFVLDVLSTELGAAAGWLGIGPNDPSKNVRIRCLVTNVRNESIRFTSRGKPEVIG